MKKRYITIAGRTIMIRESASTCVNGKGKKRKPKENKTPEAVEKVNRINRIRELTGKLNHNFQPGDLWLTLTYENMKLFGTELSREECKRNLKNFRRKLQRWAKKNGMTIKLVDSFGIGHRYGRPHHHVVISDMPTSVLQEAWTFGGVHIEMLKGYNYSKIAKYMLKDSKPSNTGKIERGYNCTRNVVSPTTKVQNMKVMDVHRDPEDIKPFSGYTVDKDTINVYEHPIFETECIEYIMVSLEAEPRLTKWSKGRTARQERQYSTEWPEQLDFEEWMDDIKNKS